MLSRRLETRLADDTWFWGVAAILLGTLSVLKGLRLPSLWAATQAQLDYHDGFIKRGLFGSAVHLAGIPIRHYDTFVTLSTLLLAGFLALLIWWVLKSGARHIANGAAVALFAASFIVTYLAHLIGYLEIPSGMLALAALLGSGSRLRPVIVLLAGIGGVLLHENYVLTFLPLPLLPLFLAALDSRSRARDLVVLAVVAVLIAGVVVIEASTAPMDAQRVATLQSSITSAVDFHPRDDFFAVMTRSATDNVSIMLHTMGKPVWWAAQLNACLVFLPLIAYFLWIALRIVGSSRGGQAGAARAAVIVVGLCPLLLQLVGWDIYRWYALAAFNSFIAMTIVGRQYGPAPALPQSARNIALLLMAVNMATGTGLFDGYRVDTFPFIDHWRGLFDWLGGGRHWLPPAA